MQLPNDRWNQAKSLMPSRMGGWKETDKRPEDPLPDIKRRAVNERAFVQSHANGLGLIRVSKDNEHDEKDDELNDVKVGCKRELSAVC